MNRSRLGRTSACLILAFTLLVAAASVSGSTHAARQAVAVQQLRAAYHGPDALVGALNSGDARARALARTDLDADGGPDLVVGYAWHGAGIVTVQRGNPDAVAPKRQSVFQKMQRGFAPDWLVDRARALRVPEPVSYVEAGDFNRDRRADVLVGALGGGVYLLAGDGRGGLGDARQVPLAGRVTTLAAGQFRAADGRPDVAVGVATRNGPALLVYDGAAGVRAKPMRFSLPARATAVQFGALDSDPYMDLAVAAGGRLQIVHGWGRKRSRALESRVERVANVSGVRGIAIGHFVRDRAGLNEIAAAFSDGTVRLLIPKNLETRRLTVKERRGRTRARLTATRGRREAESLPAWHSSIASGWRVGRPLARGAAGALAQHLLTTAKLSLLETDDLLVADAVHGLDLVRAGESKSVSHKGSRTLAAALTELNAGVAAPTAVLPMPLKANGERGLVVLGDSGAPPTLVTIAAAVNVTVDRFDDPAGAALTLASACTAAANDCSLRGAVQLANANPGSTINLGAGTYTLSINGDRGCVGGGEPAATGNTVGDLEINQSTTITGAGRDSTIIRQIGTGTAANPGDRVMCLNTGFLVGLQYTFSGLTITGGRSTALNIGGGGIIGGELDNSLTLNAVRVSNNQDVPLGSLGGGGIQITGGNLTITNSLIGGTQAPCVATDASCKSGVDRTNVNMGNLATRSGGGVAYTPSSPAHTGGTGTLTVTGSTISHNSAGGIGGGGFDMMIVAFASPGGIGSGSASISTATIANNQATGGSGGGIVVESLPTTVASSSITSNSASNAGGGIYVGGGGLTLNGTSPSTVTLSGNTAAGGGTSIGTAFNVTVQGTGVSLGGDVLIGGGGNWTNSPGSVIAPTDVTIKGGTFNANDSTTNMSGNFTFGPTPGNEAAFPGTFNSGTGTFNFNGSGAQSIIGPNSPTFNNLVVNKPSGALALGVSSPVKSNLTVSSGVLDLGAFSANRTAAGGALTVSNGATLKIGGTGSLPANYATHALGTTSTVEYNGSSGAQTIAATNYGHLTSSSTGARTLAASGTVGVAGAFTPGTNTYTVTGSTVDFNGSAAQTISAFNYNNLTSSSTGARTLAASGTIGVAGAFTPGTNAYTVTGSTVNFNGAGVQTISAFAYNNLTSSSTGARTLPSGQTVSIAGAFTPGTNAYTVTGSTVNFNGAGAQTIPALGYNNLTSSSTGGRTLAASGTVGVAGAFTPGTNAYTVTGSTVNFNGAGAQTIPAFAYNNLTSSSTGVRTLPSGQTVSIAGAFTPGTNTYTVTGSTVNFNGAGAQTIPAFAYNNLTISGSRGGANVTLGAGTIGVAGAFSPSATSVSYVTAGNTVSLNGTTAQAIPAFTFNNLTDANTAAAVSLTANTTVNGALTVNANTLVDTTTFVLTVNGTYTNNGQIRHGVTQVLSTTVGPFNFADGLGVETARLSGLSVAFGSTTANTAAGGSNPYNSCSVLPPNPVRRFWQITSATSGTAVARFSFRNDEVAGGVGTDQLAIYRCLSGGSWTQVGTAYTRPAPAGPAAGYSSVEATGVPFVSAGATYIVAQGTPDLTVLKTNNVSGATKVGNPWTWTLHVANGGSADAVFANGQAILSDNLPNSNLSYGSATVANVGGGVTGGANITCGIASNDLTCAASGGTVTIGTTSGSFDVVFTATPSGAVMFTNPRSGGSCSVDPNNNNTESNEGNNACSDSVVVSKADTTTTITSDAPDPSVVGQSVSVQYGVAVTAPGAGTPTGNVTVTDGSASCTSTVAAGQCSLTLTSAGAKSLTATYAGDANFNASPASSPATAHQVDKAETTTSISSDLPDPSNVGQQVTVKYAVGISAPGGGTPTGNVTVSDGTVGCTGTVAAGECTITFTAAGSKSLTATYASDSNFMGSTSASEAHHVRGIATTTTITSDSPDASVVGQSVTVQYSVVPSGAGTPTGNVAVSDGTASCTGAVAAGQCSLTLTSAGAKSLTATYEGDANFEDSTSAAVPHQVDKAETTTSITSDDPDPSVVGQSVTVHYSVAVTAPGAGTATGNVTVTYGTQFCTATVAAGQCSFAFTSAGATSLTATYAGDSNFNGSTSTAEAHVVNTIVIPPNPVRVVLTVVKSGTGGGTVTSNIGGISCGLACTANVDQGTAVTLSPAAAEGSTFVGWGGACGGAGSCTVTMDVAKTVSATFNLVPKPKPKVFCVVPNVKGKTLAMAKRKIAAAHCRIGKVTRVKSKKVAKRRVISQRPAARRKFAAGHKVNLTVSRGRR